MCVEFENPFLTKFLFYNHPESKMAAKMAAKFSKITLYIKNSYLLWIFFTFCGVLLLQICKNRLTYMKIMFLLPFLIFFGENMLKKRQKCVKNRHFFQNKAFLTRLEIVFMCFSCQKACYLTE